MSEADGIEVADLDWTVVVDGDEMTVQVANEGPPGETGAGLPDGGVGGELVAKNGAVPFVYKLIAAPSSSLPTVTTVGTPGDNLHIPTEKAVRDAIPAAGEPALGTPAGDGYILSSTIAGVRSWIARLVLGTTSGTAAAGDHGHAQLHTQGTDQGLDTGGTNAVTAAQAKAAYTHSGVVTGNPHAVTAAQVGAATINGHVVKASGTGLTQRASVNFIGAGVKAADNDIALATDVTIPGVATFADDNARTSAIPIAVNQPGYQTDTGVQYRAIGTSAGNWVVVTPASVGAATAAQGTDERVPTAAGMAAKIHAADNKATLADADEFAIADSEATYGLKRVLWSYIKGVFTPAAHAGSAATSAHSGLGTAAAAATGDFATAAQGTLAANAIPKATADANSILYAVTDDSPAALALAANQFPARSSSGNIVAKSITDFGLSLVDDADAATARGTLGAAPMAAVRHVFWPAGAAIPNTTNGAATGTVEAGTNKNMYDVFDFDSATSESVQFVGNLEHWGAGTIKAKAVWTYAGSPGGTNVQWSVSARAYANDDAIDQAFGTAQVISDDKIAAGDAHITGATPAITVGGTPANGQPVIVRVARDVANDDLAADARLLGIIIEYTESATAEAAW